MNFKQGLASGLIVTAAAYILYIDWSFAKGQSGNKGIILIAIFSALAIILFCTSIYVFPVLSRFKTKVLPLFKTAFFLSIRHLPSTILMAIIILVLGVAVFLFPIVLLFVPALGTLIISFLMERVLKKYMPKKKAY